MLFMSQRVYTDVGSSGTIWEVSEWDIEVTQADAELTCDDSVAEPTLEQPRY